MNVGNPTQPNTYVCTYTHIHTYIYTHTYTHTYIHIHTYIHTHIHTCDISKTQGINYSSPVVQCNTMMQMQHYTSEHKSILYEGQ